MSLRLYIYLLKKDYYLLDTKYNIRLNGNNKYKDT